MKTKKRGTFKYLFFYYNCQLLIVNYQLLSLRLLHCPFLTSSSGQDWYGYPVRQQAS
jgi:hypothetical protein